MITSCEGPWDPGNGHPRQLLGLPYLQKLKMTRSNAWSGICLCCATPCRRASSPRCHFEDITRADFYGFVVPFATELMRLAKESASRSKSAPATRWGLGVSYPGGSASQERARDHLRLRHYAEVPAEWLNGTATMTSTKGCQRRHAWLYGAAGVNCSLLGIGERTGNVPLEAMIFEYISLRGTNDASTPPSSRKLPITTRSAPLRYSAYDALCRKSFN